MRPYSNSNWCIAYFCSCYSSFWLYPWQCQLSWHLGMCHWACRCIMMRVELVTLAALLDAADFSQRNWSGISGYRCPVSKGQDDRGRGRIQLGHLWVGYHFPLQFLPTMIVITYCFHLSILPFLLSCRASAPHSFHWNSSKAVVSSVLLPTSWALGPPVIVVWSNMVLYPLGEEGFIRSHMGNNTPWDFDLNTKEGSQAHVFLRLLNGKTWFYSLPWLCPSSVTWRKTFHRRTQRSTYSEK